MTQLLQVQHTEMPYHYHVITDPQTRMKPFRTSVCARADADPPAELSV